MKNLIEMPVCMMAVFNRTKSKIASISIQQDLAKTHSIDVYFLVDRIPNEKELTQVELANYQAYLRVYLNGLEDNYVESRRLLLIEDEKWDGFGELSFSDNQSLWVFNYYFETKAQREELRRLLEGSE